MVEVLENISHRFNLALWVAFFDNSRGISGARLIIHRPLAVSSLFLRAFIIACRRQSRFRSAEQIEKIRELRSDCEVEAAPSRQNRRAGRLFRGGKIVSAAHSEIRKNPESCFLRVGRTRGARRRLQKETCLKRPIDPPRQEILRARLSKER